MRANEEIRTLIESKRLRYWEVAQEVGITDGNLSVWLRKPLNVERKQRVIAAIEKLTK